MKRVTICVDVQDKNLDKLLQEIGTMYNALAYTFAEYDPHFNWDVAIDEVDPVEEEEQPK